MTERFPRLGPDELTPEQADIVRRIADGPRGQFRGPFVALIHSPLLAGRLEKVGEYLRFETAIPKRSLEIGILLVGRHYGCANIWKSHHDIAVRERLDKAVIAAISERRAPSGLTGDDAAVYDFCAGLLQTGDVPDAAFDAVVALWGRRGAADLVGLVGYYTTLCHVFNVARFPLPPGSEPFGY